MIRFLKKGNNALYLALFVLTILNLIQGYTTELLSDEAYYWSYSQNMDWGYFDHPPMVAVWIFISSLFFENSELSVRFFAAFTLSATIFLIWKLIDYPKKKEFIGLFLLVVLSTVLFTVYGFITVPDTPLLLFLALFLVGYKKYLKEKSWVSYLIITLSMAGMLYSKYQGILIIFFVLLSNLKVLKDYKIWIAALGTILLFFPHLYWQFINDFPSFRYHLYERSSASSYKFEDTLFHFLNIIAIIGLTFPIVYYALFKNLKNKDAFNKALNFIAFGFPTFFFFMSFKGHVQAQWIVPTAIPLIIITFNYLVKAKKKRKLFTVLATLTIAITLVLRFLLANDVLPIQLDFHGNKTWVSNLEKELNGTEPIFMNSYQNASTYWFYSKKQPLEYNAWWSRKNNYDLLKSNTFSTADKVAIIGQNGFKKDADKSITKRNNTKIYIKYLENYTNLKGLKIDFLTDLILKKNAINTIDITVKNPYKFSFLSILKTNIVLRGANNKFIKIINAQISAKNKIITGENRCTLTFKFPTEIDKKTIRKIQVVGQSHEEIIPFRLSKNVEITFLD